jgi:hypothetical protein
MMNCKGFELIQSWTTLNNVPEVCLERLGRVRTIQEIPLLVGILNRNCTNVIGCVLLHQHFLHKI